MCQILKEGKLGKWGENKNANILSLDNQRMAISKKKGKNGYKNSIH